MSDDVRSACVAMLTKHESYMSGAGDGKFFVTCRCGDELVTRYSEYPDACQLHEKHKLDAAEHDLSVLIEAREQAAAVEMRERCAKASYSFIAAENIRGLPIPTDALDAMLLKARIEELDSWAKHAAHDWHCPAKKTGKGPCWVCERKAELQRQLASLEKK